MKILKIILILLVVAIVGLIGYSFTIDGNYDSKSTIEMEASPATIQGIVSDLTTWEAWGPWVKTDATTVLTYSENSTGQDAWYTWKGDSIGEGKLTIVAMDESSLNTFIEFGGMGTSNGYWKFEATENGTAVTWGMDGEMGMMGKLYMLIVEGSTDIQGMMDEMAAKDFVEGLEGVKEIAELQEMANKVDIEETTVESLVYFSITEEITQDQAKDSEFYGRVFGELMDYLGPNFGSEMTGKPFTIFHKWDDENNIAILEVSIPSKSSLEGTDRIKKGNSHAGKVLKAVHKDTFDTGDEHWGMHAYAELNDIEMIGSPWEIYATDPATQPIVIEVYYPVK